LSVPRLSDGVVELRPFSESDAPALAAIWADPSIRARNTVPEPDEEAARAWVVRSAALAADRVAWEWAIVDRGTGELAGRMALKQIDWTHRRAVVATWVAAPFRGRRFAGRALRLAAAQAFGHGMMRVHAECEADNEASVRSLIAAGMRREGTLRAYFVTNAGGQVDAHVLGMLPEDLAAAPAWPT
jgi:RimJ/RimL family protein N-acetyltransferase